MPYLRWAKSPAQIPPAGVTVSPDADGTFVAEAATHKALVDWQLTLLRAAALTPSDLLGSGESAPDWAPASISREEKAAIDALLALPAGASKTQFVAARDAITTAQGRK